MVIQKAVDNLKGKSDDDKKVVAGGIAITIVALLLLGWAFLFFKKVQRGNQELQFGGTAQDEFNFSNVRQAQQDLMKGFTNEDELTEVRQQSGSQYQPIDTQTNYYDGSTDQFGGSGAIE